MIKEILSRFKIKKKELLIISSPALLLCVFTTLIYLYMPQIITDYNLTKNDYYFYSLRENSTIGCSTLSGNKLDYLVVGDSHSYTAYDFLKLSRLLDTKKIGTCTLGGYYFETMIHFIKSTHKIISNSKYILYGLSYRQFTNGKNKASQIDEHMKMISDIDSIETSRTNHINNLMRQIIENDRHKNILKEYGKTTDKWTSFINSLKTSAVSKIFKSIQNVSSSSWKTYLAMAQTSPKINNLVREFCDHINANKIKLILIDIPESPFLSERYSPRQRQDYEVIKKNLKKCAIAFLDKNIFKKSNDNRYFLNRSLKEEWLTAHGAKQLNTPDIINDAYDYDHMNLIGAQYFTQSLAEQLKLIAEKQN